MKLTKKQLTDLVCGKFNNSTYIPNPGNAGDAIIAKGTIDFFESINLDYEFGSTSKTYPKGKSLIYAGGGNLVGVYKDCERFLEKHPKSKILILPHTIKDCTKTLKSLNENVHIICREQKSYDYVKKHVNNCYLYHDMAFEIDMTETDYKSNHNPLIGDFFRVDCEKTNISIPTKNRDISKLYSSPNCTQTEKSIRETAHKMFEDLSQYSVINTNRLHVAIAACLLDQGKLVNFHSNNYWKNEEVYKYSFEKQFDNCYFRG